MTTNQELQARREQAVARGAANITQLFADRAENAEVWDVEGKRYIDFAGGIGVLNIGHRHPKVVAAVQAQLDKLMHTCFHVMPYEPYIALAEKLNEVAPGDSAKKTLLLNTGAEAVENAIKVARAATGRSAVIAFNGGFHGRTMMGMALTGKVAPYKQGFGPFPAEVFHAPYPNPTHGVSSEESLEAVRTLFKVDVDPQRVAAIIIEPVQGEGGFYRAPTEFMQGLRALCDEHGILLIADEVQSGFARTGTLFAVEQSGIEPDMVTMAKSMAGGMTISALVGKAELMDVPGPGSVGSTYGGSPMACAGALATIEVIEEENLLARANEVGSLVTERFNGMAANGLDMIQHVRAAGAMAACEIMTDGKPDGDLARALVAKASQNGLLLLSCGTYGNTIRVLMPLTASDELINEGLDIVESCLKELTAG
ncbi:MAG: 4-aminobutyrate--2-oxoglutarate transaminase [Marinobacterium sp.]|nr:4-aminobutyrate--2-oxoglutarate transaminase [Marinobacterium sp.]